MLGKVAAVIVCVSIIFLVLTHCSNCGNYHDDRYDISYEEEEEESASTTVYISTSPRAEVYHVDPRCMWLKNTTHAIDRVSLEEAESMGRRPCKGCSIDEEE